MYSAAAALLLLAVLLVVGCLIGMTTGQRGAGILTEDRRVFLISIDGFRYEYLKRSLTPTLAKLARSGAVGPMQSQFPTYTFPNHFSIVTGLYPESHGIVNNAFYDAKTGDYFSHKNDTVTADPKWWLGSPIWNEAERHGVKSAVLYWPGARVFIHGRRATYTAPYESDVSNEERSELILKWLDADPSIRFLAMYFPQVDTAGHHYGPNSRPLEEALQSTDQAVASLIEGLARRGLLATTDFVIVSDHGMTEHHRRRLVFIEDLIADYGAKVEYGEFGPITMITPRAGMTEAVYREVQESIREADLPIIAYRKEDIPAGYHYQNSSRISPLVLECALGWDIASRADAAQGEGQHGYDPTEEDMAALFLAAGPSIAHGEGPIARRSNLDVFPLLGSLLGITLPPHNGTIALADAILRER